MLGFGLKSAFGLGAVPRLAFVGSGGKTTALFHLAREYQPAALVTATSHLELAQVRFADFHCQCRLPGDVKAFRRCLPEKGVILFTGEPNRRSMHGVDSEALGDLLALADEGQLPLLIESDGSRRRPIKAPAEHEPPIPAFVDTVVVVAGLSAIGRPFSPEWVQRPEVFSRLAHLPVGEAISIDAIRTVLCHPSGGQKNIPPGARRIALLSQVNSPEILRRAQDLAMQLLDFFHVVVVSGIPGVAPGAQPPGWPPVIYSVYYCEE